MGGMALALAFGSAGGILPGTTPAARADSAPDPGTPPTVTADALPTWQVDGVVWSQVVVGNTVYATGQFATARPPGVAVGGAGQIAVGNLIAYDIRTGDRISTFNHVLNGQGLVVHASADETRLYVGGDFTTVDGEAHGHIAAFDLTNGGTLVSAFAPALDGRVSAIATSGVWVYVGGDFSFVGDTYRARLAALHKANGGLSQTWKPQSTKEAILSMVMAPDQSKVIIGGSFADISGVAAAGSAAVDPTYGTVLPWAVGSVAKATVNGGITNLTTDGSNIFGTGYAFGAGATFEGVFSANPDAGQVNWIADCLGDHYSSYPASDVVYAVGHAHNCSNIGSFPDTSPRVRWQRGLALTKAATQMIKQKDAYGWDFVGYQAPSVLHWFPQLDTGKASGQGQAAWSIVGNRDYVALGGEFPRVNNANQQGLTRFATSTIAPNKARPRFDYVPVKTVPSVAAQISANTVRVSIGAAWDRDNESLTYDFLRDGAVVGTVKARSNFWTAPLVGYTDTNVPVGAHSYKIRVSDSFGNNNYATQPSDVTVTNSTSDYAQAVLQDKPSAYWRLDEPFGSTVIDFTGNGREANAGTGVTRGSAGATGDGDSAVTLSGTAAGILSSSAVETAPDTFTTEAWFNTTTTTGGKLIGFGNATNGSSTLFDRHVYMDNTGKLRFGVQTGTTKKVITSVKSYNNGAWHHVAATLSPAGTQLYVDGELVGRDVTATSGMAGLVGQWVIGGDAMTGWSGASTSKFFKGLLDDVAVYPTALGRTEIRSHVSAALRTPVTTPAPTDTYGVAVQASKPSFYWRLGEATGTTAVDSSGNDERGTYAGTVTYGRPGAVGGTDTAVTLNGSSGNIASTYNWAGPTTYSAEVWFKTTSTKGGKLIGFGTNQTGTSTNIDRNLAVLDTGALRFTVGANGETALTSPATYRDGQWHQAVVTQGADGMQLYVDGSLVASGSRTTSQDYAGYWRVGGDKVWSGSTSGYLAGDVDEVSLYSRVLTAGDVAKHYTASGRVAANLSPTAAFEPTVTKLSVDLDASSSQDPDGTIAAYMWDFGDGSKDTGAQASYTYSQAGTYLVMLTVTDDRGGTGTSTQQVTVVANAAPVASFTSDVTNGNQLDVDASASTDSDGTVAAYSWDFGDGATATGATASHTYESGGTFTVQLTVTDNDGATDSKSGEVTVIGPNQTPVAAFTAAVAGDFTASLDATGSSDPDGTITGYDWAFGDGQTGTGATLTHVFPSAGIYTVTLTVHDDRGGSAQISTDVTVTGPFAMDTFSRTVTGDWGTADVGGAWTRSGGASLFGVVNGVGTMRNATAGTGAAIHLNGVSSTGSDLSLRFSFEKIANGGGQFVSITGRGSLNDAYRAKVQVSSTGAVTLLLVRVVAGAETTLATKVVSGLTVQAGSSLSVRLQTWGTSPTNLQAKVWASTDTEPGWTLTATDSTASLQAAGSIGLRTYLSGSATNAPTTVSFDDVVARQIG